jgi:hypothetical protein
MCDLAVGLVDALEVHVHAPCGLHGCIWKSRSSTCSSLPSSDHVEDRGVEGLLLQRVVEGVVVELDGLAACLAPP